MSFSLHGNLSFYPQFMFNLRRSPFVQAGRRLYVIGCVRELCSVELFSVCVCVGG
jgi:hypothetical protein